MVSNCQSQQRGSSTFIAETDKSGTTITDVIVSQPLSTQSPGQKRGYSDVGSTVESAGSLSKKENIPPTSKTPTTPKNIKPRSRKQKILKNPQIISTDKEIHFSTWRAIAGGSFIFSEARQ
ncbi:hypothetical protein HHI36_016799 [Cryptolaemus montrouzieri]|uniref:Uncharacterized protein n=1 Tax=Cryptolaemus montrouzieri TaxID=559131 RepID=A0ABD2NKQ1_9CUCU